MIARSFRKHYNIKFTLRFAVLVALLTCLGPSSASAITPPDSCFGFDSASKTISAYYDNEANDSASPACPKDVDIPSQIGGVDVLVISSYSFSNKSITSVSFPSTLTAINPQAFSSNNLSSLNIPDSVTFIGNSAFRNNQIASLKLSQNLTTLRYDSFADNQLSTVVIPDTLDKIESGVFLGNNLTSLTLGNSIQSIAFFAFGSNKLVSVNIPNSVTSIATNAFALQSPLGRSIDDELNSGDSDRQQNALEDIWYVQLYTADSTNPNNLKDMAYIPHYDETTGGCDVATPCPQDFNGDGDTLDVYDQNRGGHIINPAPVTLMYQNASGSELRPSENFTGKYSDGTVISDYLVRNGPDVPAPVQAWSPTATEIKAMEDALAVYQRIGQTFSYTAPAINGLAPSPDSVSFVLGATNEVNSKTFVYGATAPASANNPSADSTPSDSGPSTLQNTGVRFVAIIVLAGLMIISAIVIARHQKHRYETPRQR